MEDKKKHLFIKQSKAEVIATKCLQHQSFNVLKRNIIHNIVYTINKMRDVNEIVRCLRNCPMFMKFI